MCEEFGESDLDEGMASSALRTFCTYFMDESGSVQPRSVFPECVMSKLPNDLRQLIDNLCQKGDQFAQIDQQDDALDQYEAAWELLPNPKNQWPAATWILMAAGDVYFEKRDFVAAIDALRESLECPDGEMNSFIRLRLGQCLFELGDLNEAANALEVVFRNNGEELFADEDPKYLNFVKTQIGIMKVQTTTQSSRFNKPLLE